MTKKTEKKQETKNDNKTAMIGEPWKKDEKWVRLKIVNPKLVLAMLERCGLPIDGTEQERTDRLSSYFVHEERKKKIKLVRCVPNDEHDSFGCGFMSDEKLDVCPFCGSGDEIVTLPKDPPKADVDIELNVKAAEKKAETKSEDKKDEPAKTAAKKGEGGVAKVSSKDVRAKKKERGEVVEEKLAEPSSEQVKADAIAVAKPEVVAIDVPTESVGGTAADLDRICSEIYADLKEHAKNQAVMMWRVGKKFSQIRDLKLWSTVRREDGSFNYANFGSFVAQRFADFEFTLDHAMLLIRIAGEFSEEQAIGLGSAKAKAILDARNARNSEPITEDQKNELVLLASTLSLSELRAKIKWMQAAQLPAPTASGSASVSSGESSSPDESMDEDDEDSDDDEDDDAPDSTRPTPAATSKPAKPAQMTSVSFEKREFSIPLAIKGSQVKPAKKIQDEPHGTLSLPGGSKIHFVVRIGDDGQLFVDGKVETPY